MNGPEQHRAHADGIGRLSSVQAANGCGEERTQQGEASFATRRRPASQARADSRIFRMRAYASGVALE